MATAASRAKFLNLRLDGKITDNLSYSWRQRFTKTIKDGNFFDATDRVYLGGTPDAGPSRAASRLWP